MIIDELPTIYFKGLDNLIATARSNKVAVCLGFQDFSQLERDYGKPEAAVVMNTVGNIFSGQVVGNTAKRSRTDSESIAETAIHEHKPSGRKSFIQYPDGCSHTSE